MPKDPPPTQQWMDRAALQMIRVRLHHPEPEEWFDAWLAEAPRDRDAHMHYAYKTWREISTWNATELQTNYELLLRLMVEEPRSRE